jgi:outer membrane biosynthesis protein TonB
VNGPRGEPLSLQQVKQSVLITPIPQFSVEFRRRRISGSGIFEMHINPKTGKVKDVHVLVSTRNAILDNELARVCSTYQFKPGTITQARVPMGFGWTRVEPRSNASKWVY